jgi:hypothetical protein
MVMSVADGSVGGRGRSWMAILFAWTVRFTEGGEQERLCPRTDQPSRYNQQSQGQG